VIVGVKSFGGVSPRTPARYLQDGQAQVAINCPAFSGSLQPLRDVGSSLLTLPKTGVPKTIYRFGQGVESDTQFWFHWPTTVDVVKGPIAADTTERTYFTGDGSYPKVTTTTLSTTGGAGGEYPYASYRLGVPHPTAAAIATIEGVGDATSIPEERVYVYTFINGFGEESAPSAPSNEVTVLLDQNVRLSGLSAAPSGAYNVTHRRFYRSTSGTYLFVGEQAVAETDFLDDVLVSGLGEELPSLSWDEPPADLKGIVAGPNGMMAGFVGNDVYFSEPFRPFAWPVKYSQTVDYPVVGIGVMDTTFAVLTKGVPYFLQGGHPDSITAVKSDIEQACVAKRSIVSFSGAVIYASPDGLVMLSPGGSKVITEQLFMRDQWQQLNPSSMHAYQHDRKYVCFYDAGATKGGFIFDFTSGVFIMHDVYAECGYADLRNDTLYLAFTDRTLSKWDTGNPKTYQWVSKKFTMPQVTGFSVGQLEAEAYPVTMKTYADGVLIHTQTVTGRDPYRLPATPGRDWEVELIGNTEVFAFALATSMQELAGV